MLRFARIGALILLFPFIVPSIALAAEQWANPVFASGWTNYANSYRPVSVVKSGTVVTISGLARRTNGKWGHITTLPTGMRPSQRLVFNVSTHDRTARVDVLPNGQIFFIAGNKKYNWVSLDGISFSVGKASALKLTPGWQNYGGGYANANGSLVGNTVIIGGLVKPAKGSVIATLPPHLRPANRLIFNLNSHDKTSRVDVFPDGKVIWVFRAPARGWISLNGITFERKPGAPLQLVQGWKKHRDTSFATPNVTRTGKRISVSGLTEGTKWGHLATLPKGMCPKNRLIFNLNNHERSARVDVLSDCKVVWVAGGKGHGWINLDGMTFVINQGGGAVTSKSGPRPKLASIPWVKIPGGATDISVGANGAAWIIGGNKQAGGFDIWRYKGKNAWQRIPGGALRIAVDPKGNAWVVNSSNTIFRYDGSRWQTMPGRARDISIGANGAVWVAGTDGAAWRWNGKTWIKVGGGGISRLAVDPKNGIWAIANGTQIWRYDGRSWKKLPGAGKDIGVGANGTAWVVGTDNAPYRWDGRTWKKHTGGINNITVDAKGYIWGTNPGKQIWVDRRSAGYKKAPKAGTRTASPVPQTPVGGKPTANKSKLIADAKKMLGNLGGMAGPVSKEIKRLVNTANHLLRDEGQLLKADVKILNQKATIVIYRPIAGQPRVNFVVMTDNLKVSNLIKPAGGTPVDDLKLVNTTYIFVPRGNAQDINVNKLPPVVAKQVAKVRTGPIELVANGHNIFSTINTADGGPTAKLLKLVGVSLGDLKVHINYGFRTDNKRFKSVRMTRAGNWNKPFHLANTVFNNATLDLAKLPGNARRLRGWGTAKLKGKPYFLFVQKTGSVGPYPTAAAVDAKSISLKDYKNLALIFGESVFGSTQAMRKVLAGIDKVPLDKVRIENPKYKVGGALDQDNNPVFDKVLLMAASAVDTLPDANKTKGPIILAHGKAKVFGFTAGSVNGWVTKKGMDVKTNVNLPKWGPMDLGTFASSLYRSGNNYAMELKGKATVPGFFDDDITMKASNSGFTFSLASNCPRRPLGISASVNSHNIGSGSGFKLATSGNPMRCIADIGGAIINGANTVANVTQQQYNEQKKKAKEELKKIGKQASKAANFAVNKISSLFGKKKKKKPKPPSAQELFNLACGKKDLVGWVLWQDYCTPNRLDPRWKITAKQSSEKPRIRHVCEDYTDLVEKIERLKGKNKRGLKGLVLRREIEDLENELKREKKTCYFDFSAETAKNGFPYDFSETKVQKNPWWEADLKEPFTIRAIAVYSRYKKANELNGLIVAVSETISGDQLMWDASGAVQRFKLGSAVMAIVNPPRDVRLSPAVKKRFEEERERWENAVRIPGSRGRVDRNGNQIRKPKEPIEGKKFYRYLRIYRAGQGTVRLGEVQLYGRPLSEINR